MKFKYIDALRGLAISGVLVVHCGQYGNNEYLPYFIESFILNGAHGVQLFYVVSAFTLFLTLDKRNPAERGTWIDFYFRRFFRIAPMYYLGICYFLWQDGLGPRYFLGNEASITPANILANVFFVHGFNPYWISSLVPGGWSIAVEMLFYCLVPLLFLKINNSRQAVFFFLMALALRAVLQFAFNRIHVIESERLWQDFLNFYLPSQLPVFALGIVFYFVVKEGYAISVSPRMILILSTVFLLHFAGIPLLPNHVLFSIGFVGLAIALSKFEFKILVNPIMVHLGKVSYSMYLVHFAVLFALNKFRMVDYIQVENSGDAVLNYGIRLLILGLITVAVSTFFYHLIELPFQRIGKKVIAKINERNINGSPAVAGFHNLPVSGASPGGAVFGETLIPDKSPDGVMNIENEKSTGI
jgi:peptidoglycan/LPS O-acetylase OafA/YrhL